MGEPAVAGYSELQFVGAGGFSTVYRARQERFDRTVALKVLSVQLTDDTAQRRFERECRITGRIGDHPHIVTVFDAGATIDGRPYLATAFMEGGTLTQRVAYYGPRPVEEVLDIGVKICSALVTVHLAGVVHRDIKPANILVSAHGEPALADFGIAAVTGPDATSATSSLTPLHAAPELLHNEAPTPAADIYSLASTLYYLLAGRAPFEGAAGEGVYPLMQRILHDPVPPIDRQDVPAELQTALIHCLAKDPTVRDPSALEFARQLQLIQTQLGVPATAAPFPLAPTPVAGPPEPEAVEPVPPRPAGPARDTDGVADRVEPLLAPAPLSNSSADTRVSVATGGSRDPAKSAAVQTGTAPRKAPVVVAVTAIAVIVAALVGVGVMRREDPVRVALAPPGTLSTRLPTSSSDAPAVIDPAAAVSEGPIRVELEHNLSGAFADPGSAVLADTSVVALSRADGGSAFGATILLRADPSGHFTHFAGTGESAFGGDGGDARAASFGAVTDAIADPAGNVYLADGGSARVRRIAPDGIVTTIAGGNRGNSGDGGPATAAQLTFPWQLALDGAGLIYIADNQAPNIRAIARDGTISTVGGPELTGVSGAALGRSFELAASRSGELYVWNTDDQKVRKRTTSGEVTELATVGDYVGMAVRGDGTLFILTHVDDPSEETSVPAANGANGFRGVQSQTAATDPGSTLPDRIQNRFRITTVSPTGQKQAHDVAGIESGFCSDIAASPLGTIYLFCADEVGTTGLYRAV